MIATGYYVVWVTLSAIDLVCFVFFVLQLITEREAYKAEEQDMTSAFFSMHLHPEQLALTHNLLPIALQQLCPQGSPGLSESEYDVTWIVV